MAVQKSSVAICFTEAELEAVAGALGHTDAGLTGSEIQFLLSASRIVDVLPGGTKRIRLYNAFATIKTPADIENTFSRSFARR